MVRSQVNVRSKRLVFENDFVEGLVLRWKQDRDFGTYYEICRYCKNLMDSIILGSRFNRNVPFNDLVSNMFLQIEHWLDRWVPGRGTLYSYLSTCTKHSGISFVTKEAALRQRLVLTGDMPMESIGASYSMDFEDTPDLADSIIASLECRWSDPEVKDAIRYVAEEILANGGIRHRKLVLQTMSYAFDLGAYTDSATGKGSEVIDVAKFLLDWTHAAIRQAWLDHHTAPVREYDILRLQSRYSFLPDMVNVVGIKMASRLMSVFAGMSLRFPTQSSWNRTKSIGEAYEAYLEHPHPDTIAHWARQIKVPADRMASILEAWATNSQEGVLEDQPLAEPVVLAD